MKFLRAEPGGFVFQFTARERDVLLDVVQLYPLVPAAHHRLSRQPTGDQADENQRLLEESLAEQRRANQEHLRAFLAEPARFRPNPRGLELTLTATDLEWLLQVLNDIRVGSWIALGEPDETHPPEVSAANARPAVALELCGYFQSTLLAAFGVAESPDWSDAADA